MTSRIDKEEYDSAGEVLPKSKKSSSLLWMSAPPWNLRSGWLGSSVTSEKQQQVRLEAHTQTVLMLSQAIVKQFNKMFSQDFTVYIKLCFKTFGKRYKVFQKTDHILL